MELVKIVDSIIWKGFEYEILDINKEFILFLWI